MVLASIRGKPRPLATIGRTTLSFVELPEGIEPPHGGWLLVLEAVPESAHAPCDLYRVPEGTRLDGTGIVRALVLASDARGPDPAPRSWRACPAPAFAQFEDAAPGELPIAIADLRVKAIDARRVSVTVATETTEVPRYWLARMLFRVGLHRLSLGYAETYGGFFVDDRGDGPVLFGLRSGSARGSVSVPRGEALATAERLYHAVAPPGYTERSA
jgi:hypothetical protein